MRTNEERADKADSLVSNYEANSSPEECLSDLRHFCDKYDVDFAERDEVGQRNYIGELAEAKADAAEGQGRR